MCIKTRAVGLQLGSLMEAGNYAVQVFGSPDIRRPSADKLLRGESAVATKTFVSTAYAKLLSRLSSCEVVTLDAEGQNRPKNM